MKTAMQELIDFINEELKCHDFSQLPAYEKAKQLLEKEKQQIKDAFFSGCQSERQIKPRVKCWEDFYNETFKN